MVKDLPSRKGRSLLEVAVPKWDVHLWRKFVEYVLLNTYLHTYIHTYTQIYRHHRHRWRLAFQVQYVDPVRTQVHTYIPPHPRARPRSFDRKTDRFTLPTSASRTLPPSLGSLRWRGCKCIVGLGFNSMLLGSCARTYILKGQGLGNGHAGGEGRYRMGLACGRFAGLVGEYIYR